MNENDRRWTTVKLGTIPARIWIHGKDKVVAGGSIRYREYSDQRYFCGKWLHAYVHKVNEDGYPFLEKM